MPDRARPFCTNRLFEWIAAGMLLGLGVFVLFWPGSIGASAFRPILQMVGATTLGFVYLSLGAARMTALAANGQWSIWGPRIRGVGALGSFLVWLQMTVAFALSIPQQGPLPGIVTYTALAIGELLSITRAVADGRYGVR